jgi:phosphate transport system substrate-binding protein
MLKSYLLLIISLSIILSKKPNNGPPVVDPTIPRYKPTSVALTGELNSRGANTIDSITMRWIELFRNSHPDVMTTMQALASGTVLEGFLDPVNADITVQVGPCAREVMPHEMDLIRQKYGYNLLAFRVAGGSYNTPGFTHSIVFYVHQTNPFNALSLNQIGSAYRQNAAVTWGDLGATGDWFDKKINLWGLILPNGIANYVQLNVLNGALFRTDITTVTSDTIPALDKISFGVSQDPYAMGYSGVSNWNPGVKMLGISDPPQPTVFPTYEAILSKDYPLSRYAYIYVNPTLPLHPNVVEFLKVVLSYEGQKIVAEYGPFLPLPASVVAEELAKLQQFVKI